MIRPVAACVALVLLTSLSRADILVEVFPSVSPNPFSSPSDAGYTTNAIAGISAGGAATGDPGQPTYYSSVPSGGVVSIADLIATDFPYWRGTVNPAAPFDGEFGNLLTFGTRITSDSGQFSLSNVSFDVTDTFDGSLDTSGSLLGESYSERRVGVINGPGGPTFVTSGSGDQLVDALYLVGVGVGYELLAAEFTNGTPNQEELASLLSEFTDPFQVTATYTVQTSEGSFSGQATVSVDPTLPEPPPAVPAPPAVILAGVGLAAVVIRRRAGR
jgi:hypothetical protein